MAYFRELPNINYPSFLSEKESSLEFIQVKNFFRRVKLREDLQNTLTLFDKYEIPMGHRPDNVAEDLYGNSQLDWIVLTVANIVNVRDEWPMSSDVLYQYCEDKYGLAINDTRHHETEEVRNAEGKLILPAGQIVDKDYTIPNPLVFNTTINPVVPISNFLIETRENEKKRNIKVLRREFLTQYILDMKGELEYTKSSQFVNKKLKNT